MTNEEKMNILKSIFSALFQSKQANTDITQVVIVTTAGNFPGRWFSDKTLRGFDVDINTGTSLVQIRCVEQNPNKRDNNGNLKWTANLAQQGHQIMWVIDRSQGGGFLGRMQRDLGSDEIKWYAGFEPATRPVQQNYNTPEQEAPVGASMQHTLPQAGAKNAAASQTIPMDIDNLPEIPNGVDIPDYVLESIAEMDEPPEWGDYE